MGRLRNTSLSGYMVAALVLAIFALGTGALSLSMPGWILDQGAHPSFTGLWIKCTNWTICQSILSYAYSSDNMAMWMTLWVTQSLGNLLLLGSVSSAVVAIRRPDHILKARFVFVVFSMFAGFSIFSGVFVFLIVNAVKDRHNTVAETKTYYYCLYLAVTASVLAWLAALVAALYHDYRVITKRPSMPPGFDISNVGQLAVQQETRRVSEIPLVENQ